MRAGHVHRVGPQALPERIPPLKRRRISPPAVRRVQGYEGLREDGQLDSPVGGLGEQPAGLLDRVFGLEDHGGGLDCRDADGGEASHRFEDTAPLAYETTDLSRVKR